MNRSDPKLDEEHVASEDSGQESSEQVSEEESGDGDGDSSEDAEGSVVGEDKATGSQSTPVVSRVRLRSGGDSDSPRVVKRLNPGRHAQQAAVEQVGGVLSAMNPLDPRVMSTRAATLGVEPRAMYAMYARAASMPGDSEEEQGRDNSGGDSEESSEEGSGQGADEAGDEGNAEADSENVYESSQDPDGDGRGGASEMHEGGDADEASRSGGESSQETQDSLYTPSEDSPSGSSDSRGS